jgi:hypothetical protein
MKTGIGVASKNPCSVPPDDGAGMTLIDFRATEPWVLRPSRERKAMMMKTD